MFRMAHSKRYVVSERDTFETINKHISESTSKSVVLAVSADPIFLVDRPDSFLLIADFAEQEGKRVTVESGDDVVLELAKNAGLEVSEQDDLRRVYDVVPPKSAKKGAVLARAEEGKEVEVAEEVESADESAESGNFFDSWAARRSEKSADSLGSKKKSRTKTAVTLAVFLLFGVTGASALAMYLPRVEVAVKLKTFLHESDYSLVVKTENSDVEGEKTIGVTGVAYSYKTIMPDTAEVSLTPLEVKAEKASGKVSVYNTGLRSPMVIVANSRIVTPGDRIYFTQKRIAVPAFDPDNPEKSFVDVDVVAEKIGEAYNVRSLSETWHFLGLKGTSQYEQIVVKPRYEISGGSSEPSALSVSLPLETKKALIGEFAKAVDSSEYKSLMLIDEAVQFSSDPSSKDVIEVQTLLFDEEVLKRRLLEKAAADLPDDFLTYKPGSFEVSYTLSSIDVKQGTAEFSVHSKIVYKPEVDKERIIEVTRGRSEQDLKASLFSVSEIESASVSLWPRWFKKVPDSLGSVDVTIE